MLFFSHFLEGLIYGFHIHFYGGTVHHEIGGHNGLKLFPEPLAGVLLFLVFWDEVEKFGIAQQVENLNLTVWAGDNNKSKLNFELFWGNIKDRVFKIKVYDINTCVKLAWLCIDAEFLHRLIIILEFKCRIYKNLVSIFRRQNQFFATFVKFDIFYRPCCLYILFIFSVVCIVYLHYILFLMIHHFHNLIIFLTKVK